MLHKFAGAVLLAGFFLLPMFSTETSSLFSSSLSPAAERQWSIEVVDSLGDVGTWNSLAIDSHNRPHISYVDNDNTSALKYAVLDNNEWKVQVVTGVDSPSYTSLALDMNDFPHISFHESAGYYNLKYAYWDGSKWQTQTVDDGPGVGEYTSLALDSEGRPHISYYDYHFEREDLKYAFWDGSTWNTEVVDSVGIVGHSTSLVLDSNDNPHISYTDLSNWSLKYATWDGSKWIIQTLDDGGLITSITLDTNDYPHISYQGGPIQATSLRYIYWDGSRWNVEIVEPIDPGADNNTSLVLDSNNYPHIAYNSENVNGHLKYASWNGSNWDIQTVDNVGRVGYYKSLKLDAHGNPHISYSDSTNDNLKYAHLLPCSQDSWYGEYFANRELEGNPAFTSCDENIDFFWGDGVSYVGGPKDNFSVRWTRTVEIAEAGWYRFRAFTDDGVRLNIDGELVIDDWVARSFAEKSAVVELSQGKHQISVEFVEWENDAMARLDWYQCRNGHDDCTIDVTAMYQTSYPEEAMPNTCINDENQTIASYGCLLTSIAMALESSGVYTSPKGLNMSLSVKDRNGKPVGYEDTCYANIKYGALNKLLKPYGLKWEWWNPAEDVVEFMRREKKPIILQVPGTLTHYLLAVDIAEKNSIETLGVYDPHHAWICAVVGSDKRPYSELLCPNSTSSLRHTLTQVEEDSYRGVSKPFGYITATEDPPSDNLQISTQNTEIMLTDEQGRRAGFDMVARQPIIEIPGAVYFDSKIIPPGTQSVGLVERVLFIPQGAGGNYRLEILGNGTK